MFCGSSYVRVESPQFLEKRNIRVCVLKWCVCVCVLKWCVCMCLCVEWCVCVYVFVC